MKVEGLVSRVEGKKRTLALRADSRHATRCYRLFYSRIDFPQSPVPSPQPRAGMTLVELLVVVVIITTLVAAAIPLIAPSNDDRRLREAARGLNTFIAG